MALTINAHARDYGPEVVHSPEYRQMIEDHRLYILNHHNTELFRIRPNVAYRCDGDFTGVLDAYNVPRHIHWVVMRINGYTSPFQYRTSHEYIHIPSQGLIERLLRVHRVNRKRQRRLEAG